MSVSPAAEQEWEIQAAPQDVTATLASSLHSAQIFYGIKNRRISGHRVGVILQVGGRREELIGDGFGGNGFPKLAAPGRYIDQSKHHLAAIRAGYQQRFSSSRERTGNSQFNASFSGTGWPPCAETKQFLRAACAVPLTFPIGRDGGISITNIRHQ